MPVGGHTADALAWTKASDPKLPGDDIDAGEDQEPPRHEGNAGRHLAILPRGCSVPGPGDPGAGGKRLLLSRPFYKGTTRESSGRAGVVPGYCLVFKSAETLARAGIWLAAAAERPGVARVRFLTVLPADSANPYLALEQVRHIGDDGVLAEQERALDEQGRLVVHDVLPPSPREELG